MKFLQNKDQNVQGKNGKIASTLYNLFPVKPKEEEKEEEEEEEELKAGT